MATSLTRNGNFISVYPRAVPRRRGDTGQRGGAWNVTNKAHNVLEAGLTAATTDAIATAIQHSDAAEQLAAAVGGNRSTGGGRRRRSGPVRI